MKTPALFFLVLLLTLPCAVHAQATPGAKCVPPPPGLRAWWRMDEGSGSTAKDWALIDNAATLLPNGTGPTWTAQGMVDCALCFDGLDDYAEAANHPNLDMTGSCTPLVFPIQSFSVDCWVRWDGATPNSPVFQHILDKTAAVAPFAGYTLYIDVASGKPCFSMVDASGNTNTAFLSSTPLNVGQWHFLAVRVARSAAGTQCPGAGCMLRDGQCVLTFTPPPGSIANTSGLRIGKARAASNRLFKGCLDEIEIFKRALDKCELDAIYHAGSAGKCRALTTCWQINCPKQVVVTAPCPATSMPVTFNVTATGLCGQGNGVPTCTPPSGSTFPVGTTNVLCEILGPDGKKATCCFPVIVRCGGPWKMPLVAGKIDNFSGGIDPAPLSPCMVSLGASKAFDNPALGTPFRVSLGGGVLPQMDEAKLYIRMRPRCTAAAQLNSSNDTIAIAVPFFNCTAWVWRMPIRDLCGTGCTWDCVNNKATTFVLDLANLPGGGNLLPFLNAGFSAGWLDIEVENDTEVDWVKLKYCNCLPAPLTPLGPPVSALGAATLSYDAATRSILVGNLGSSGNDGAAIDLGSSEGWSADFKVLTATDTRVFETAIDAVNASGTFERVATSCWDVGPGGVQLRADFSPLGSTTSRVTLKTRDGLPLTTVLIANYAPITVMGTGGTMPQIRRVTWDRAGGGPAGQARQVTIVQDVLIVSGGQLWPSVGQIEIEATDSTVSLPGLARGIIRVINSGGTPVQLNLDRLNLVQFGARASSANDTSPLDGSGGAITFDHEIPTTQDDRIALGGESGGVDSWFIDIEVLTFEPEAGDNPPALISTVEGSYNHSLATLSRLTCRVAHADISGDGKDDIAIDIDHSGIGLATYGVVIYRGGAVVADLPNRTGPVGSVTAFPDHLAKLPTATPCGWACWDEDQVFLIGGNYYVGDTLRLRCDGLTGKIDYYTAARFHLENLPSLTATGLTTTPANLCRLGFVTLPTGRGLSWTGTAMLESSPNLNAWTPLPALAPPPVPVPFSASPNQFFRLRFAP